MFSPLHILHCHPSIKLSKSGSIEVSFGVEFLNFVIHCLAESLERAMRNFAPFTPPPLSPDISVSLWDLSGFTKMIHLVEHMLSIESSFAVEFRNVVM